MKKLTILTLAFVFVISCQPKQNKAKELPTATEKKQDQIMIKEPVEKRVAPKAQKVQAWYEGGTLHKANGTQWKKGTDHDKLATCADFTMTLAQQTGETPSVKSEKFKQASESLRDCINKFFDLPGSDQATVSKAAIQCWSNL